MLNSFSIVDGSKPVFVTQTSLIFRIILFVQNVYKPLRVSFLIIFLISNYGFSQKTTNETPTPQGIKNTPTQHNLESNNIQLDNGKRWIANPETKTGIENMISIMSSFEEKDNVDGFGPLTESLKSEFSMIFKKCTMTGEAHNQLHNFLLPIKGLLETLPSNNLNQSQERYDKLNNDLKEFNKYFK